MVVAAAALAHKARVVRAVAAQVVFIQPMAPQALQTLAVAAGVRERLQVAQAGLV